MSAPFTEQLRQRVMAKLGYRPCSKCGLYPNSLSTRQSARRIGVNATSLFRFLRGGNTQPSAELINKLVAWVEKP